MEKDNLNTYITDQQKQRENRTFTYSYDELRKLADVNIEFETMRIEQDLARQPAIFDLITQEAAKRSGTLLRLQADLKRLEAKTRQAIRARAVATGEKITEAKIEEMADADDGLHQMRYQIAQATEERDKWRGLAASFEQRHDMLRSIKDLISQNIISYRRFDSFANTPSKPEPTGKFTRMANDANMD